MTKANLRGADLTGADLRGTFLSDTDLRGIKGKTEVEIRRFAYVDQYTKFGSLPPERRGSRS
nr:pentapeptide repeat-containing protein [Actinomadura kijaniata]